MNSNLCESIILFRTLHLLSALHEASLLGSIGRRTICAGSQDWCASTYSQFDFKNFKASFVILDRTVLSQNISKVLYNILNEKVAVNKNRSCQA